mmetsp:Transcript_9942/g.28234  ORF Transcript_9942/g.28234 Transcript_9942/m.28234 type:complete len:350 (-) Transcript_9942:240-1289(-)
MAYHMIWQVESANLDLPEKPRHVVVVEREAATKQGVEDDPGTPNVYLGARVEPALDDLRGGVVRTPARRLQELAVAHEIGQAEVSDLEAVARVHEDVLGLEVPVADALAVDVVQPFHELAEEAAGLGVGEPAPLDDEIEELPTRDKLADHKEVRRRVHELEHAHDIGVAARLEHLDFPLHLDGHLLGLDALKVHDLDGAGHLGRAVGGVLDLSKCPRSEVPPNAVVREHEWQGPALLGHEGHGGRQVRGCAVRVERWLVMEGNLAAGSRRLGGHARPRLDPRGARVALALLLFCWRFLWAIGRRGRGTVPALLLLLLVVVALLLLLVVRLLPVGSKAVCRRRGLLGKVE